MWHLRRPAPAGADFHALELIVERAGSALACPYASSAEYEAAIIQAKRAAGVYGPKRQRRQIFLATAAIAVLALSLAQLF